ncbi:uncharacterized protein LOC110688958 [Chenopodium quinoa]|uniref:uncharacterized protein LOC110688958 n=1 Tax=Chenopodium quinoa TaxID=63459 RepID=UPI000B78DEB8|nr:uncharacterized protein LOC110688958 [Chenopodium quinoa]
MVSRATIAGFLLLSLPLPSPVEYNQLHRRRIPLPLVPSPFSVVFHRRHQVVMAGGGRRKLGHATPRELFSSTSHANTETSLEVTPSFESYVGGSRTSTQVPQTQDGNSPMGEVPTPVARRTLHPTGLWFDDNTVSTSITNIFQAHWREPWLKYEMVDKRSEKAKKNRRGGSLYNPIELSHFQGSISASKHAKKMVQKAGGVLPTAPEVFLKTHFKEVPRKGKVAANKRA